jgi:hypothetical protein
MRARKVSQLVVVTPNEVGALADVCRVIREANASITHVCASTLGAEAHFMISTPAPDPFAALQRALEKREYELSTKEALEVHFPNAPGTLEPVVRRLSEAGVDIEFLFGTTADSQTVAVVLSTNDNDRALALITAS